jgi:hypothetical protein
MTSKEFVTQELGDFIKKFPQVRVRYEFHEMSNAHFIEVVPNDVYSLNEDYISWEIDMWDRFVNLYPVEGICFISDDALVGIENAMYIKEGLDYALFSTKEASTSFDPSLSLIQQASIKGIDNITFIDDKDKVYEPIEEIRVKKEHSAYCQTFSLAA